MIKKIIVLCLLSFLSINGYSQTKFAGKTDSPQPSSCFPNPSISITGNQWWKSAKIVLTNQCKEFDLSNMEITFLSPKKIWSITPSTNQQPAIWNKGSHTLTRQKVGDNYLISFIPNMGTTPKNKLALTPGYTFTITFGATNLDANQIRQSLKIYGHGTHDNNGSIKLTNASTAPAGYTNTPTIDLKNSSGEIFKEQVAFKGSEIINNLTPGTYTVLPENFSYQGVTYLGKAQPYQVTVKKQSVVASTITFSQQPLLGHIKLFVAKRPDVLNNFQELPKITLTNKQYGNQQTFSQNWNSSKQINNLVSNASYQFSTPNIITPTNYRCVAHFSPTTVVATSGMPYPQSTLSYHCQPVNMDTVKVSINGLSKTNSPSNIEVKFTTSDAINPIDVNIPIANGHGYGQVNLLNGFVYNVSASTVSGYQVSFNPQPLVATQNASESILYAPIKTIYAPYVDVAQSKSYAYVDSAMIAGVKNFNAAFVLYDSFGQTIASSNPCKASLFGLNAETVIPWETLSEKLQQAGGHFIPSFGGANGPYIIPNCQKLYPNTTESELVAKLAQSYKYIATKFHTNLIDFDIEGGEIENTAHNRLRNLAIIKLQQENPNFKVNFTLPVNPNGLAANGVALLKQAISMGVKIHQVNIMAMDYGAYYNVKDMGKAAITAVQGTAQQVKQIYQQLNIQKTNAQIMSMIGVTPMIGVNDTQAVFPLQDAKNLLAAIQSGSLKGLGMLSNWSLTRDIQCSNGAQKWADPTCSSILQKPLEFSKIFNQVI